MPDAGARRVCQKTQKAESHIRTIDVHKLIERSWRQLLSQLPLFTSEVFQRRRLLCSRLHNSERFWFTSDGLPSRVEQDRGCESLLAWLPDGPAGRLWSAGKGWSFSSSSSPSSRDNSEVACFAEAITSYSEESRQDDTRGHTQR